MTLPARPLLVAALTVAIRRAESAHTHAIASGDRRAIRAAACELTALRQLATAPGAFYVDLSTEARS